LILQCIKIDQLGGLLEHHANAAHGCGGELNYNGFCNPQVDALIAANRVKGLTIMVNSIFNGARMEDVWLAQ
jgi:hypothetical protein